MAIILDFYVDEPACLGVPPYISPYCRYAAGALVKGGLPAERIGYVTVDQWRAEGKDNLEDHELVVLIAGSTVPGKYLGGKPGTVAEILEFLELRHGRNRAAVTVLGGPIRHVPTRIRESIVLAGGVIVDGDIELVAAHLAGFRGKIQPELQRLTTIDGVRQNPLTCQRGYEQVDEWAVRGAFLTNLHPNFPYLMNELETYRGCTRSSHCSFCSEALYGKPDFRSVPGILAEIRELVAMGNRYFRLGRQADMFTYGADLNSYHRGFPRPVPSRLEELYRGIRECAPDLKVLHLDNVNPGGLAQFETESRAISDIITTYNTPGDTAAMGLESVDATVFDRNNLKCTREQALKAIEIINESGSKRVNGIPKLLPGLNFIHGLVGENADTFKQNYEFLLEVLQRGLLLRRINIRQVSVHPETELARVSKPTKKQRILGNRFVFFREKIRREVDQEMMKRVFPVGTILKEVIPETTNPGFVLGRQIGSYPVTVKIPQTDSAVNRLAIAKTTVDTFIIGYRERSLIGLTHPIKINRLDQKTLAMIPGIGKKRASSIVLAKPVGTFRQLQEITGGDLPGSDLDYDFSA